MERFAVILIKYGIDFMYTRNGNDNQNIITKRGDVVDIDIDLYPDKLFINYDGELKRFLTQPEDIKEATEWLEDVCSKIKH
jgi:hypothetical protein